VRATLRAQPRYRAVLSQGGLRRRVSSRTDREHMFAACQQHSFWNVEITGPHACAEPDGGRKYAAMNDGRHRFVRQSAHLDTRSADNLGKKTVPSQADRVRLEYVSASSAPPLSDNEGSDVGVVFTRQRILGVTEPAVKVLPVVLVKELVLGWPAPGFDT
ncbi:hypothetical protein, partial [Mesorhizobium sp. LSJC280B00]|uniref:hypothetical protein n=1 Tax=Mesorhizobium sp. LSJC280B00 TaxID=1287336 RepID=UPI001AEC5286